MLRYVLFKEYLNVNYVELMTKSFRSNFSLSSSMHIESHHHKIMPQSFPEIEGGGSLLLAWQIRNKKVLVIGGGEVRLLHVQLHWQSD